MVGNFPALAILRIVIGLKPRYMLATSAFTSGSIETEIGVIVAIVVALLKLRVAGVRVPLELRAAANCEWGISVLIAIENATLRLGLPVGPFGPFAV